MPNLVSEFGQPSLLWFLMVVYWSLEPFLSTGSTLRAGKEATSDIRCQIVLFKQI